MGELCITLKQAVNFQKKAQTALKWKNRFERIGVEGEFYPGIGPCIVYAGIRHKFAQAGLLRSSAKIVDNVHVDLLEKNKTPRTIISEDDKREVAKEIVKFAFKDAFGDNAFLTVEASRMPLINASTKAEREYFVLKNIETGYMHELWLATQLITEAEKLLLKSSANNMEIIHLENSKKNKSAQPSEQLERAGARS